MEVTLTEGTQSAFLTMAIWSYYVIWLYILAIIIPLVDGPGQVSPLSDIKKSKLLDMYCSVPDFNTSVDVFSIHFMHDPINSNVTTLASIADKPALIELERLKPVAKVDGPKNPKSPEDWYLRLEMPPEETNGTYICNITYSKRTTPSKHENETLKIKVDVTKTGAIHIVTANRTEFTISQRDVHFIRIPKEKIFTADLTHKICQFRLNVTFCQAVKSPQQIQISQMYSNCTMVMDTSEGKIPEFKRFDVEYDDLAYLYFYFQESNQDFFQPNDFVLCNNALKEQNEIIINSLNALNLKVDTISTLFWIFTAVICIVQAIILIIFICKFYNCPNRSIIPSDGEKNP